MEKTNRPPPLEPRVLETLENACAVEQRAGEPVTVNPDVLLELLRVYRQAVDRDNSDDVGPFDFFFANPLM